MTSTTIPVNQKTPFLSWEVLLGQAPRTSQGKVRCVIVAPGNSGPFAGTAVDNVLYQLYDPTTAATLGGSASPVHRMRLAATEANKNVEFWYIQAADHAAAITGSAKVYLTGSATESKVMKARVGDTTKDVYVITGDTCETVGLSVQTALNNDLSMPLSCSKIAGTLGITQTTCSLMTKVGGTPANSIDWYIDEIPAGISITNATGSITNATGMPDWTSAYAVIEASTRKFYYIVPACAVLAELNTGTGNLRDRIGADALGGVKKRMQSIVGNKSTQAAAATFSSGFDKGTTAADETGWRFQTLWTDNALVEEYVWAARWCADRCGAEEVDPNVNLGGFAGRVVPGAVPAPEALGGPSGPEIEAALNAGCTPVIYDYENNTCLVVLSITCKNTTGGASDYRAMTTNKPTVIDYIADDMQTAEYDKYNGFKIASDTSAGLPPEGMKSKTTTPSLIGDFVTDRLNSVHVTNGLIEPVVRTDVIVVRNAVQPMRVDQWADAKVVPWFVMGAGELHEVTP